MLFMVIERFKDRDPIPVYRRVRDEGIKFPEGLNYVGSWIEPNFDRCFQLMECDDVRLIQEWILTDNASRDNGNGHNEPTSSDSSVDNGKIHEEVL